MSLGNCRLNSHNGLDVIMLPLRKTLAKQEIPYSLQYIYPAGRKQNAKRASIKGLFYIASPYDLSKDKIVVAEGAATADSIYQCTGLFSVACCGCENLIPVLENLLKLNPDASFFLAGENDQASKDAIAKASKLFKTDKAFVVFPEESAGSDFNDMYVKYCESQPTEIKQKFKLDQTHNRILY